MATRACCNVEVVLQRMGEPLRKAPAPAIAVNNSWLLGMKTAPVSGPSCDSAAMETA